MKFTMSNESHVINYDEKRTSVISFEQKNKNKDNNVLMQPHQIDDLVLMLQCTKCVVYSIEGED